MARPITHTRFYVDVTMVNKATPLLLKLKRELEDRSGLNEVIGAGTQALTRRWIREAATQRHATAQALGATPTGYLRKRANDVTSVVDGRGARLVVKGAIFARVFGPVTVLPKRARLLTIPISRESFGRRARDFKNAFVMRSKKTQQQVLARKRGRGVQALFALQKRAVLPQDAGLLPSERVYAMETERLSLRYVQQLLV